MTLTLTLTLTVLAAVAGTAILAVALWHAYITKDRP